MAFDAMLQQRIVRCIATGVTLVTGRYWERFSGVGAKSTPVVSQSLDEEISPAEQCMDEALDRYTQQTFPGV